MCSARCVRLSLHMWIPNWDQWTCKCETIKNVFICLFRINMHPNIKFVYPNNGYNNTAQSNDIHNTYTYKCRIKRHLMVIYCIQLPWMANDNPRHITYAHIFQLEPFFFLFLLANDAMPFQQTVNRTFDLILHTLCVVYESIYTHAMPVKIRLEWVWISLILDFIFALWPLWHSVARSKRSVRSSKQKKKKNQYFQPKWQRMCGGINIFRCERSPKLKSLDTKSTNAWNNSCKPI